MRPGRRTLALLALAALLTALASPCPPRDDASAAHGSHAAAATAARGAHAPAVTAGHEGCAEDAPDAVLAAPCPCGCDQRPAAASGVALELAHSLVSRAPSLPRAAATRLALPPPPIRRAPPAPAIDHVPLPA